MGQVGDDPYIDGAENINQAGNPAYQSVLPQRAWSGRAGAFNPGFVSNTVLVP